MILTQSSSIHSGSQNHPQDKNTVWQSSSNVKTILAVFFKSCSLMQRAQISSNTAELESGGSWLVYWGGKLLA
jgi:hypothetical protein